VALAPESVGWVRVKAAGNETVRESAPVFMVASAPLPPDSVRALVLTRGEIVPSGLLESVVSRLFHAPWTSLRTGAALWLTVRVPSGFAVSVEVLVVAALACTLLPLLRASARACASVTGLVAAPLPACVVTVCALVSAWTAVGVSSAPSSVVVVSSARTRCALRACESPPSLMSYPHLFMGLVSPCLSHRSDTR